VQQDESRRSQFTPVVSDRKDFCANVSGVHSLFSLLRPLASATAAATSPRRAVVIVSQLVKRI
jgi:hypothetical protein